jgi:hypothetical protein
MPTSNEFKGSGNGAYSWGADSETLGWYIGKKTDGSNSSFQDITYSITTLADGRYEFTGYKTNGDNSGYANYYSDAIFPAAGHRSNGTNGPLHNIGVYGYCRSSSPNGNAAEAYILCFSQSGVYPGTSSSRQDGFPVRCIKNY